MVLGEGVKAEDRTHRCRRLSYEAGSTTSSWFRWWSSRGVRSRRSKRRRRGRSSSTSGPTAPARSPAHSSIRTFVGFERAPVARAVHFVCLTEYDPTIPAPVAFPKSLLRAASSPTCARRGTGCASSTSPRRRSTRTSRSSSTAESRRPRRGRSASSSPARRSHVRPATGDERARGHRERSFRDRSRGVPTSTSSTTPTATWSATPASSMLRSQPWRPSTTAVGRVVRRRAPQRGGVDDHHRRSRQRRADGRPRWRECRSPRTRCSMSRCIVGGSDAFRHSREGGILADVAPTICRSAWHQSARWSGRDAACCYTEWSFQTAASITDAKESHASGTCLSDSYPRDPRRIVSIGAYRAHVAALRQGHRRSSMFSGMMSRDFNRD
jgi:hypothetical protein